MNCLECSEETTNPKFCNRSCSAKWNNRHNSKRKLKKSCRKCPVKIKSSRTYCDACYKPGKPAADYCKKHKLSRIGPDGKNERCKKCAVEAVSETRRKNKMRLVNLFGGGCQVCLYSRSAAVLQFHHVDESTKSFAISHAGATKAFKRLFEESKKCVLLCSNCHFEAHNDIIDISNLRVGPILDY